MLIQKVKLSVITESGDMSDGPAYKEKAKEVTGMKSKLKKLEQDYGQRAFENKESERSTMRGFNIANAGCKSEIRLLKKRIEQASAELKKMPKKVPP